MAEQVYKGKIKTNKNTGESDIEFKMPEPPSYPTYTPPPIPKFDYLVAKNVNAIVDQIRKVLDGVDVTTASKALDIVDLDIKSQCNSSMFGAYPVKPIRSV